MNFTIKYHKPAQACMCLTSKPLANWTNNQYYYNNIVKQKVCTFKDVNYDTNQTIYDELVHGTNTQIGVWLVASASWQANCNIYNGLTAYASSESITDFDDEDYVVANSVGTISQSFSIGYTDCIYTILVSNISGQSDITVNSIKFTKPLLVSGSGDNPIYATCLLYSCYLDEPVIIPAGHEKDFTLKFSFLNS